MIIELLILFVIIILSAIFYSNSLNNNKTKQVLFKCMDATFYTSISIFLMAKQVQNYGISKAAASNLSPLFCSHNGSLVR